jgi:nicotinamidase-related amidase
VPLDLAALVDPAHTALVTQECQKGVIGKEAALPHLAEAAADTGMIDNVAVLVRVARAAGVPVVHCTAEARADRQGANRNARLFAAMEKSPPLLMGTPAVEVLDEIGVDEGDLVLPRWHGLSPMSGTSLDAVLRNMGATTIVGVGVSANVAMPCFTFDAVNRGYQFVLPRDAIAGVPAEYADEIIDNTLTLLATIVMTADVVSIWNASAR